MSWRAFHSHPSQVPALVQGLAHRGTEFFFEPPEMRVVFHEDPRPADLRALDELRPYVFEYLLGCALRQGRFFCQECTVELTSFIGGPPAPGDETFCFPCARGELSFARLNRMGNFAFGPFWLGDN